MREFYCSAILFDLDGVLIDSTRSVARQWTLWGQDHGIDPGRVLSIAHGRRAIEVIRLIAPHLDAASEVVKLEKREAHDTEGVDTMPGAIELLTSIPPERWGIVTSGTRYLAIERLRLGKLPLPRVLVSADDVVNGKPHPEPYLKGAQLLGVPPANCLVVEDAPNGIQAAHAAGMRVIGITSTYGEKELASSDALVKELSQMRVVADGVCSPSRPLQLRLR